MVLFVVVACLVVAEDLAVALAVGRVSAVFRGDGGSSGDSIELPIAKTAQAGPVMLRLRPVLACKVKTVRPKASWLQGYAIR